MKSELEVSDDLINDFMILDKGNNRHPTSTLRTDKRILFIMGNMGLKLQPPSFFSPYP